MATHAGPSSMKNGIDFSVKNAELEKFTLRVASSRVKRSEIAKWLKNHSRSKEKHNDTKR